MNNAIKICGGGVMMAVAWLGAAQAADHPVKKGKRVSEFGQLWQDYSDFKNMLQNDYGFDYGITYSMTAQYGAPSGKKTAFQSIAYPDFTWTWFNDDRGNLELNAAYNIVQYSGANGEGIGERIGVATPINDYTAQANEFPELYFTYQLPNEYKWLSLAAGQFPIYNFDGTTYDANQQENFINWTFAQNASSTYSTAGLGGYVQASPNDWVFTLGAQDATNIDGESISASHLDEKHYTTFGSIAYNPMISGWGQGQYSVLVYNQPWVKKQPQTTNGWSINAMQNLGEKWAVFGRANGVSGDMAIVDASYMLGVVCNNPWERNALDQLGLAVGLNHINEEAAGESLAHKYETVAEGYAAFGISQFMTITPDVEVYFNPAENSKSDQAFVFSLRATVFF
ncbi:MAG: carbohydrate porin [Alphaproteobacteria bacterium]|nr:carbohydrate porin [Alphaproteobacteria bacterium]